MGVWVESHHRHHVRRSSRRSVSPVPVVNSAPSFFFQIGGDSFTDLVQRGSNLEAPLGPLSILSQRTRIIIESPLWQQFKNLMSTLCLPPSAECMESHHVRRSSRHSALRGCCLIWQHPLFHIMLYAYISGERNFAVWPTNLVENFSALMVSGVTAPHFSRVFWKSASISGMQSALYR